MADGFALIAQAIPLTTMADPKPLNPSNPLTLQPLNA
jgi:hypothetical protein